MTELQGEQTIKLIFFEDGSIMTAPRQCALHKVIAYKMSYEPMSYWFRTCDK